MDQQAMQAEPDDTNAGEMARLLERLQGGDLGARNRIIELCSDRLRLIAHRMLARFPKVRRWDDTDDVFQNAALRLHQALGRTQPESPRGIMALAATQLHRELIDLARRYAGPMSFAAYHATRAPGVGDDSSSSGAARPPGPEAVAESGEDSLERWTLFHEAIAKLPGELREVFHLVWYLGVDQKSIATLLDCSERTVKTRWREARETVRAALGGQPPR
jgi:RNA polymerase sigma factor (sigma-70 family)